MIRIVTADQRHFSDFGWLKTYWMFSFADYHDPANVHFGALRVFNDDIVEPKTGFPTHPHHEMEIITIVLDGEITHKDSMGNKSVIKVGDVQRMSAGTGLTHSEYNLADRPVHFFQIWIFPDKMGLTPSYDQRTFASSQWKNRLLPLASGQAFENTVKFHADATIFRADLDPGKTIDFDIGGSRLVYIYMIDGEISVNDETLQKNDQARIEKERAIALKPVSTADFILIDLPSREGWG